jgi:hypothetical protein
MQWNGSLLFTRFKEESAMLKSLLEDPTRPSLPLLLAIIWTETDMPIGFRIVMFGFAMSCLHLGLVIQRWLRQ